MSRQNDMKARYDELKLNQDQIDEIEQAFARADKAQREFETWSQEAIDRTIRSVAQIVANSKTFHELVELGIQESAPSAIRSAVKPSASRSAASCAIACARNPSASSKRFQKSASSSMPSPSASSPASFRRPIQT